MMDQQDVLIVGGGMAGLSLAISLCRAGFSVEIVEANPQWNVYGVGVILQANALRALDTIGMAQACVQAGYPYELSRHFDAAGAPLRERIKPRLAAGGLPASCGMLRPVLHELLSRATLSAGARVRLGCSVTRLAQDADGVTATFTDASQARYAMVVGADGLRSTVRQQVFGDHPRPRFTGQGCWRFTLPRFAEVDCAHMYHDNGRLAGLVPLRQDLMYLLLLSEEPGNPRMATDTLTEGLRKRLHGFGDLIARAAQMIPSGEDIVYRPLEPLLVEHPWCRGRVVLVGDAAHATTPHMAQGASMAFEDSVVLTECLVQQGLTPQALLTYSERRYERCRLVVRASLQIGEWQMRPDPMADAAGLLDRTARQLAAPL